MAQVDRAAPDRLDHRRVHVPLDVTLATLRVALRIVPLGPLVEPARRRAHRDQIVELVTAIDVHHVGDRPEPVGGIEVAVAHHGVRPPPQALVAILELDRAQIVQVAALGVQDLAEQALARHVEDHHLRTVVVAVLHHDAVLAMRLGELDQPPAVVDRVSRRHLGRGVLAVLHRRGAHGHVPPPRGGGEDEVEVLVFAHAHEVRLTPRVERGRPTTVLDDPRCDLPGAGLDDVADRDDLHPVDAEKVAHVRATLEPDPDEADADDVDGVGGERSRGRRPETRPLLKAARLLAGQGRETSGHAEPEPGGAELEQVAPVEGLEVIPALRTVLALVAHPRLRAVCDAEGDNVRRRRPALKGGRIWRPTGSRPLLRRQTHRLRRNRRRLP